MTAFSIFQLPQAFAWKPYTHNYTAHQIWNDVVDDGRVTLAGKTYQVDPRITAALLAYPQHFYAGSVGPDGFPDLVYGQAVIHPTETGNWLRLLWREAWNVQSSPNYSSEERKQVLAFVYGFMVHASGDVWGHTFANDFSLGVFPTVGEIVSDSEKAGIALRHIISEGCVGDATPGFDGNSERGPVYDWNGLVYDISDDCTMAYPYDAPKKFLYEVLVKKSADTPMQAKSGCYPEARGLIIGTFLTFQEELQSWAHFDLGNLLSLSEALEKYEDTVAALHSVEISCDEFTEFLPFVDCSGDPTWNPISCCGRALANAGFTFAGDTLEAFEAFVVDKAEELAKVVLSSYLHAWSEDIDSGLHDWGDFGLALTRGLFAPQARRDYQNDECQWEGGEETQNRANCEDGAGSFDVVMEELDPFINDHLLSMAGLPDAVGQVRSALSEIGDVVDDVLGWVGIPFNPIQEAFADIKEYVKEEIIEKKISEVIGVDINLLSEFLKTPYRYMCLDQQEFTVGGVTIPIQLFATGESERLDGLMGLTAANHVTEAGLPGCGRLKDDAVYDPEFFAPVRNTIVMGKLLLLDGPTLNAVLSDILERKIVSSMRNVMLDNFDPREYDQWQQTNWLAMIDGDHAWRANGLPRFVDEGSALVPLYPLAIQRTNKLNGGHGNFPMWESVVLRPAFRVLFKDWENSSNFPDLDDPATPDLLNDPNPPVNTLQLSGDQFHDGANLFVGKNHFFVFSATDTPADMGFADDTLELQYRVYQNLESPGAFRAIAQQGHISLPGYLTPGDDGKYLIEIRSGDPCHTITNEAGLGAVDPYPPGAAELVLAILDTTPPKLTGHAPPFGMVLSTDAKVPADFSLADGTNGSGVATYSATIDGYRTLPGVVSITINAMIDTYYFYPGVRTVHVTSADNLGNSMEDDCTFEIHATVESLLANVRRAAEEGLIRDPGIATALTQMLRRAGAAKTSANSLGSFVQLLEVQRGRHVDGETADRFMAYARDMMAAETRADFRTTTVTAQ